MGNSADICNRIVPETGKEENAMKLLLAEDEKSLSKAVRALLERSHYSVDTAFDGKEALEYLECGHYDGVILDIMMPVMDGISVLKKIRGQGNLVPVILLTAKSDIDDKVEGLDQGANDYLTKPFAARELLARVRAMLRSGTAQTGSKITFGNVCLDCSSYELSTPYGNYPLANKEYQLMELLMKNTGQVLSAEHLFDKIWSMDSEADIHVVWTYISYLRKKLTALKADITIRSRRNIGYYLECKNTKDAGK